MKMNYIDKIYYIHTNSNYITTLYILLTLNAL